MKRRQRRPVLDINGEQSVSPRRRWQNKYQQIVVDHPDKNGSSNNPLSSLLRQYNSDSETEDSKQDSNKLDDKVNDFLKEIQLIAPEHPKPNATEKRDLTTFVTQQTLPHPSQPSSLWQECFDESTGYPYYWHTVTNEVTWEIPGEMRLYQGNISQDSLTHPPHAIQWANFSSNTYPELQTNIPEGMIPKEVVARNRNKQVNVQGYEQQKSEIEHNTPKKVGVAEDDLDDGKIEMITSFGSDESESDASDNESVIQKESKEIPIIKSRSKPQTTNVNPNVNKKLDDINKNVKIGPSLPLDMMPMVYGPENPNVQLRTNSNSERENKMRNDENPTELPRVSSLFCHENSSSSKLPLKSNDVNEEDILKRLKNQAKLLQSLGEDIPKSVETLIKEDSVNVLQTEKETALDRKQCAEVLENLNVYAKKKSDGINTPRYSKQKKSSNSEREIKISLVAGYSDDSDAEEEISPQREPVKPLFPISNYQEVKDGISTSLSTLKVSKNTSNEPSTASADNIVKKIEVKQTDTGSIRIFEYKADNVENSEKENKEVKESSQESDKADNLERLEQEVPKSNKFLENLEVPTKAFQRKKRIAFDVMPTKIKPAEVPNVSINKTDTANSSVIICKSTEERHGLGFSKEQYNVDHLDLSDGLKEVSEKSNIVAVKSGINFIKGETINVKTDENIENEKKSTESNRKDLKCSTETIMEKLKFLSEGSQTASAVQIMAIQLQTLLGAWEAGDLKDNYLCNWLTGTGRELGRLEQAAAPPGWDCQWDRSHKRYYYRNTTSGETQWTYPETDIIGGTEEMDLCTTPPPPDQEEPSLIEQTQTEPQTSKRNSPIPELSKEEKPEAVERKKAADEAAACEPTEMEVPPPPQISNPSPPPPPRICAEDLKKSKKRRSSAIEKGLEPKREKLEKETTATSNTRQSINPPLPPSPPNSSQPPLPPHPPTTLASNSSNSEPLPPGVDAPDMTYPMTASTIEPNLLYTATSQNNPIYAATLGNPTVPIIDHHAAIMQGQIIHYPAYHQHLHSQQAIIAAANRLTEQDAVQFMVADYAHVYTNSQIIAKPPVKTQRESLGSALNSFYNDIASIEKTNVEQELEQQETPSLESVPSPVQVQLEMEQVVAPVDSTVKERKRKKIKTNVSKKQKEMSSMVAKWQKAQQHLEDVD